MQGRAGQGESCAPMTTKAAVRLVSQAWVQASRQLETDYTPAVDSIPSTASQLVTLARSQVLCFGCLRRKKIGLVSCWRCWDEGRPEKITNGVGASVYETQEEEEYREAVECFYACPLSQQRLVFAEWVGLHGEKYIPSGPDSFITGKRRMYDNRKLVNSVEIENPDYQPLSSATASVLLCGARSDELVTGVRYMHSNVYRREVRDGVPLADVRLEQGGPASSSTSSRQSVSSLQVSASMWSKPRKQSMAVHHDLSVVKTMEATLQEQTEPMMLLHSADRAAAKRALLRLLQTVVALTSRTHRFVRACPTVLKREALMFRSLARMRNKMLFGAFSAFIDNVFEQQKRRAQALGANKMVMRMLHAAKFRCFDVWHIMAARNARGRRFLRKRMGGIKLHLFDIWKTKWAEEARAKDCEAKARAFIQRYKYQTVLKCLHALNINAVGQIKLRKYMKRWLNMKLVKSLKSWRELVERNQRVRAFIRKHLQGMRDYCFETWADNVREELESRKVKLKAAMYRMRNRVVVASFSAISKYWHLGLACKEVQRVFRGFCARVESSRFKIKTLKAEVERHTGEELKISSVVEAVTKFQATIWAEDSVDTASMASGCVKQLRHHNKEETLFRYNAHRIPSAVKQREKQVAAGGAGALFFLDDVRSVFDQYDCQKTGFVSTVVLEELLWVLIRRPPSPVLIASGVTELNDPLNIGSFTFDNFIKWFFSQSEKEVTGFRQCHVGMIRNRKFLNGIELREIGRATTKYAIERAQVLGRYLYRFTEDAAPRFECSKCRHGFRLPSQLRKHRKLKSCQRSHSPYHLKGTIAFQEAKELIESGLFPKLDTECTSRPRLTSTQLHYFKPELTFNGHEKESHVRINITAMEHVRRGDPRIGDERPVLLLTEHVKLVKKSKAGLKKYHCKVYHALVLKDEDDYDLWKDRLKRLCGKQKQLRRLRQEQRDQEREARRIKRALDLAARSAARRLQFAEESKEKAVKRRLAETKEREAKLKARELALAQSKMKLAAKHDELIAAKRNVGNSHLVAQAHAFIAGTDEASEALALAELGLLPSSDEEDDWELQLDEDDEGEGDDGEDKTGGLGEE